MMSAVLNLIFPPQTPTLRAVDPETGTAVTLHLDFKSLEDADRRFRRFARLITHKGYVLEGAR
jgi:hypothetical protein